MDSWKKNCFLEIGGGKMKERMDRGNREKMSGRTLDMDQSREESFIQRLTQDGGV